MAPSLELIACRWHLFRVRKNFAGWVEEPHPEKKVGLSDRETQPTDSIVW